MYLGCCIVLMCLFFFKQRTAYEMRISDWSSDVCSSDLFGREIDRIALGDPRQVERRVFAAPDAPLRGIEVDRPRGRHAGRGRRTIDGPAAAKAPRFGQTAKTRVESALAGARDFERGCDDMGEFARPLTPYRPAARRFGNECGRTDQSRGSP